MKEDEYVKQLEDTVRKMLTPIKHIPFKVVIRSLSGCDILDFDQNSKEDQRLLSCLVKAMKNTVDEINKNGIRKTRPNEVGNAVETYVKDALNSLGCKADTPFTKSGKKKSSGYPDVIFTDQDGRYNYLECKTFNEKGVDSSLRSFYLSPSEDFKITKTAHHLLVSFQMINEEDSFYVKGFKLVTLENLYLDIKHEFNANNKELYKEENILYEYYLR